MAWDLMDGCMDNYKFQKETRSLILKKQEEKNDDNFNEKKSESRMVTVFL